jgi:hypothetical protein
MQHLRVELENRYGSLAHREFKSLPLRSHPAPNRAMEVRADITRSVLPLVRGHLRLSGICGCAALGPRLAGL